jgi:hypothetical protein
LVGQALATGISLAVGCLALGVTSPRWAEINGAAVVRDTLMRARRLLSFAVVAGDA